MHKKKNQKILVRLPNWLGDAVMASAVLSQIHELFDHPQVYVTGPGFICDLFKSDPRVAAVFAYRPKGWQKYNPFHPQLKAMRKEKFDLAIVLTQSISSAWQIWCTRAKERLGFSNEGRFFLLTHALPFPQERETQHLVLTYQNLLNQFLSVRSLQTFVPKLYLSESSQKEADVWFETHVKKRQVVGLCPQAAYGPAKQWHIERFHDLAIELVNAGYGVIVFADAQGKDLGEAVCQGLDASICIDMSGKTNMGQFIALMQKCSVLVTNDSGPMHLAAALDKHLVALFGSTDDVVTGPYSDKAHVIHKRVECSPCFQRVCPIDFRCMRRIEVSEVFQKILHIIHS